ncbi:hypothetical protein K1X76_12545 [bacterium]|nr:hypothetical protein [bacterium]
MLRFRSILPFLSFFLFLSFATALTEEFFHCPGESESASSCNEQCCAPCATLHTMAFPQYVVVLNRQQPTAAAVYFSSFIFTGEIFPTRIERPPIA